MATAAGLMAGVTVLLLQLRRTRRDAASLARSSLDLFETEHEFAERERVGRLELANRLRSHISRREGEDRRRHYWKENWRLTADQQAVLRTFFAQHVLAIDRVRVVDGSRGDGTLAAQIGHAARREVGTADVAAYGLTVTIGSDVSAIAIEELLESLRRIGIPYVLGQSDSSQGVELVVGRRPLSWTGG